MAPSKVWEHFTRSNKNKDATCKYCREVLQHNGSTSCLWNHYNYKHKLNNGVNAVPENSDGAVLNDVISSKKRSSTSDISVNEFEDVSPTKRKRKSRVAAEAEHERPLSKERQELITQAVTQMISMDILPLSFVENEGFKFLMSVVEPAYKVPSRKTITGNGICYKNFSYILHAYILHCR